jgi:hypothetical protein
MVLSSKDGCKGVLEGSINDDSWGSFQERRSGSWGGRSSEHFSVCSDERAESSRTAVVVVVMNQPRLTREYWNTEDGMGCDVCDV